ncbi:MAG: BNR-4 repeat-containing protein [Planctomycetes bacterium]|nr:BNR-4 repeat-containing protein [Planctomycetota bacterium]
MDTFQDPFRLSTHGSTRATAYGFSNKSVTIGDRTHVVWVDAISKVMARTYDWNARCWSETCQIFEGADNHTTPALTVDREKHIHVVGGPHGWWGDWNMARFKWFRSREPNSVEEWGDETNFGYNATYACMLHMPCGLDAIAYRGGESPRSLMFQRQRQKGGWTTAREILRQDIEPQYTHNSARISCDSDGTLYIAGHFYNVGDGSNPPVTGDRSKMRSYGAAALKSEDMGRTWTDLSGNPVAVPVTYSENIAVPPVGGDVRLAGLSVDSEGDLWALISDTSAQSQFLSLCLWNGEEWNTRDLGNAFGSDRAPVYAVMTIDAEDHIHIAAAAVHKTPEITKAFAHPSSEVFHVVCDQDVQDIQCCQVSIPDEKTANWMPNLSMPGPFNPVQSPVILYTHGEKGDGCRPETETDVYCVLPGS